MWREKFSDPTIAFKLFLNFEAVRWFFYYSIQLTLTVSVCYLFETYLKPILTFILRLHSVSDIYLIQNIIFHHTEHFDPRFIK